MPLMQQLRRWHTFLGCFFAPLLIFFIATGWYQTLHQDRRKGPGEAEAVIDRMRSVHADALLPSPSANEYKTKPFRYFVVLMAVALLTTIVIGIVLAFRFSRQKWLVALSLLLGLAVPWFLLWIGQKQ